MPTSHTSASSVQPVIRAAFSLPLSDFHIPKGTLLSSRAGYDTEFGGRGRIYGEVEIKGTPNVPVARRVRLFDERSGIILAETWSDPTTGAYEFKYLKMGVTYTVVTYDYTNTFRAVAADNLLPEAM